MTLKASVNVVLGGHWNVARRLLQAAEDGDAVTVAEIITAHPQLSAFGGFNHSTTALHRAAACGHVDACRAILDPLHARAAREGTKGGKWARLAARVLDQRGANSQTPLMAACAHGHTAAAAYLLGAGADPTLVDWGDMRTCLHLAALGGHVGTLRLLCSDATRWAPPGATSPPGPLRDLVLSDVQVGQAKYLDLRSYGGLTPLHCATVTGSLEAVRVLLAAGAAIMVRTDGEAYVGTELLVPGSTPLHMAVVMGHASIVHAILQAHQAFMGAMGRGLDARGRRPWEGSSRSDIRSVRNSMRRLPFHLARERQMPALQALVDPRVPVDVALDASRDSKAGIGPKRLSTLCSMCLQAALLDWLDACAAQGPPGAGAGRARGAPGLQPPRPPPAQAARVAASPAPAPAVVAGDATPCPAASTTPRPAPSIPATPASGPVAPSPAAPGYRSAPISPLRPTTTAIATPSTPQAPGRGARGPAPAPASAAALASLHAYAGMLSVRRQHSVDDSGAGGWGGGADAGPTPVLPVQSSKSITLGTLHGRMQRQLSLPTLGLQRGPASAAPSPHPSPRPGPPAGEGPIIVVRTASQSSQGVGPAMRGMLHSLRGRMHSGSDERVLVAALGALGDGALPGSDKDKALEMSPPASPTATSSHSEDAECGVCLDSKVEVAFAGCEHALCLTCARHLTQASKKPPHCPFCRRMVVGFTRVPPLGA